MEKTVETMALEALKEAEIMEHGRAEYNLNHVFEVAEHLSGVPYSWIKEVYYRSKQCTA